MKLSLLLGAALALGQTDAPSVPRPALLAPSGSVIVPTTQVKQAQGAVVHDAPAPAVNGACTSAADCSESCGHGGCNFFRGLFNRERCGGHGCCDVTWLKPWTCDDLKMEPVERKAHCCHNPCGGGFLRNLLICPEEVEEEEGEGKEELRTNVNGNGNGATNGELAANGEDEAEEDEDLNPLMQALRCRFPTLYCRMDDCGVRVFGWAQAGYTVNFDSPRDRLNFGTNFNNRSNDILLNQLWLGLEKPLDLDNKADCFHMGYRVDFVYGHDAPYWANFAYGLFDNFTGDSGTVPNTGDYGIDMPQFYVDFHLPILTKRGIDVRVGRFWTLIGGEVSPGPQTDFYSHNYEYFYAIPFTHTGVLTTTHIGDTLDVYNGLVRGWEVVFEDNNDATSYLGGFTWNSCDKRNTLAVAWVIGPEQNDNVSNDRYVLSAYYTRKFGCRDQYRWVNGGHVGWEENAANDGTTTANWHGLTSAIFYTIDPRLVLGARAEWFRDEDGVRTAYYNRPGYKDSFYEVTLGVTYKPYQNLRIRPEVRYDWSNHSQAFNDRRDRSQVTLGMDVIWEY